MFCSFCGKEVNDGEQFCPFCGKRVDEEASVKRIEVGAEAVPPAAAAGTENVTYVIQQAPEKKKSKGPVIGIIIALVAVAAFLVGAFVYPGFLKGGDTVKIDLGTLAAEPEVAGYEGSGEISKVTIDEDKYAPILDNYENSSDKANLAFFLNSVTYKAEPKKDLKNGDEVTIEAIYDQAELDALNKDSNVKIEVTNTKTTYEVKGLEEEPKEPDKTAYELEGEYAHGGNTTTSRSFVRVQALDNKTFLCIVMTENTTRDYLMFTAKASGKNTFKYSNGLYIADYNLEGTAAIEEMDVSGTVTFEDNSLTFNATLKNGKQLIKEDQPYTFIARDSYNVMTGNRCTVDVAPGTYLALRKEATNAASGEIAQMQPGEVVYDISYIYAEGIDVNGKDTLYDIVYSVEHDKFGFANFGFLRY